MNEVQIRKIVEVVSANPGIQMDALDAKFGGMILGAGSVTGITEDEFDHLFIGEGKPIKKVNGGYYSV